MSKNISIETADLLAIVNLKGGAGKTLNSWHILPAVLSSLGKSFQIFEIDDNNNSFNFELSDIVSRDKSKTVKTDDEEIAADIVLESITSNDTIIIDGGGGNDTRAAINLIKSTGDDINKIWLIPFDRTEDYFELAIETAELINEPDNTYFILNGYSEKTKVKEFGWFNKLNLKNYIEVPYSDLYGHAQKNKQTIFDLAQISKNINKSQAKTLFAEKFTTDGTLDKEAFKEAFNDFLKSELAAEVVQTINDSFISTLGDKKSKK